MSATCPAFRSCLSIATATLALVLGASAETPTAAPAQPVAPYAPPAPESATLKETLKKAFLVGAALNARQYGGTDARTTEFITREFNCATAENDMKWEEVEPKNNQFDFAQADKFIDFCQKNGLVAIGHNLCWHTQLPEWVSNPDAGQATLTKEILLARLKNHILTTAAHFKGKVLGWDVVNEAIADGTGEYRDSVFYRLIGKEFIALAFKWAHEADPGAELYYNDYNIDADDAKRAKAVELIKYLREQGVRIDGIGLQGHYNLTTPTAAKIDETIQMFADLGLKVMITELDVEAVKSAQVTGAVGAATGATPSPVFPRFFPAAEEFKAKLQLTDAQCAEILPIVESATKDLTIAVAARKFSQIRKIRTEAGEKIRPHLTAAQLEPFAKLMVIPSAPPPPPLTPAQQQDLAKRYGEIFEVFLKHRPVITRVTFWGVRDSESWRRRESPLLFDDNFQRKPAFDAVINSAKRAGL